MQKIITNTEQFDRHATAPAPSRSEPENHTLYITKAHLLPGFEQTSDPPVVHAQALGYAMIEWPQQPLATGHLANPADTSNVGTRNIDDTRRHALHATPHRGLYAALLFMLANSHH
jgi:hypothetical protein